MNNIFEKLFKANDVSSIDNGERLQSFQNNKV